MILKAPVILPADNQADVLCIVWKLLLLNCRQVIIVSPVFQIIWKIMWAEWVLKQVRVGVVTVLLQSILEI